MCSYYMNTFSDLMDFTHCVHLYLPLITEYIDSTDHHHQLTKTELKSMLFLITPLVTLDHAAAVIHWNNMCNVKLKSMLFKNDSYLHIL